METPLEILAPCGLYCGVCRIYFATQNKDLQLLKRLAKIYARKLSGLDLLSEDDMLCDGCGSNRIFAFCRSCAIRDCTREKRLHGCHECDRFPCNLINKFPSDVGKRVMMRCVPYRRKYGDLQWIETEEQRYYCPDCGERLFRGVTQCSVCNSQVCLD